MKRLTSANAMRDRPLVGCFAAVVAVGVSYGVRILLGEAAQGFPFVIFLPPVVVVTFCCGLYAGIFAAVLAGIVADVTLIAEPGHVLPPWPQGWLALGFYALTVAIDIALINAMKLAFNRAAWAEAGLRRANEELETRVGERTAALQRQIVDREAAEAQIRQMQKMETIGQLTGGIAHDFNNMLAVVIGSLELARRRIAEPARALASIGGAEEGARRASQLVTRLLAFSRQQELQPRILDANALVSGMSDLLRRTLGESITIEIVLADGPWRCFADAMQIENAVLNLAVNARDAMPGGGTLTIETVNADLDEPYTRRHVDVEPGQYVMISVADTGTGMPDSVIERAFDPFFTTKEIGKGTGLGLSQVYGFVKQSGGHVAISSATGVGTTIKLYLPRNVGAEIAAADTAIDAETPVARSAEIVLVVEDEPGVRRLSVDALRELGYTVVHAGDARQALDLIEVQPRIDLLFTDIVMPEMNGRALAEAARNLRPDLKIVFTTGYAPDVTLDKVEAGVAVLPKPFTLSALATKVRDVLDGRVTSHLS